MLLGCRSHCRLSQRNNSIADRKSDGPEFTSFDANAGVDCPHHVSPASFRMCTALRRLLAHLASLDLILRSLLCVMAVLFLAITKPFFDGAVPKTATFQS